MEIFKFLVIQTKKNTCLFQQEMYTYWMTKPCSLATHQPNVKVKAFHFNACLTAPKLGKLANITVVWSEVVISSKIITFKIIIRGLSDLIIMSTAKQDECKQKTSAYIALQVLARKLFA